MELLKEKIIQEGVVKAGQVLKVDHFLNHQIDVELLDQMGQEFYNHFKDKKITKILTIEASGIAIAVMVARYFKVPVVFAKKNKTLQVSNDVYTSSVASYTHQTTNQIIVSKSFLSEDDHVLIVDDFLAQGEATLGLISLVEQAGGTVEGIGIAIEKGYQAGGTRLREAGYDLLSLAIVLDMCEEPRQITLK